MREHGLSLTLRKTEIVIHQQQDDGEDIPRALTQCECHHEQYDEVSTLYWTRSLYSGLAD